MAERRSEDSLVFRSVRQFREHYFPRSEAERTVSRDGTPGLPVGTGLADEALRRIRQRLARASGTRCT